MAQDIKSWNPDDKSEWESTGKAIVICGYLFQVYY